MAVAVTISCPSCKKTFKGKEELEGKKIRCPACGEPFQVRMGETLKVDRGGEEAKAPPKPKEDGLDQAHDHAHAHAHHHDDDEENEEDDGGYGVDAIDLRARCPNCANPMESEDAVVCLYCGYNTATRTWGRMQKTFETMTSDRLWWLLPGFICLAIVVLLVIGDLWYCLQAPYLIKDTWMEFMDHESTRMWTVILSLFIIWGLGYFCYSRLILNPTPPEQEKD
jgi:Zn finger protein HypA/HybF involved in hydrogenase expression